MGQLVSDAYPELYHYTTASGLLGIVRSQELWATSISFLNDNEEHTGYFDRRLLVLLEETVRSIVAELEKSPEGKAAVVRAGGLEGSIRHVRQLGENIRQVTLDFNSPYITSFCGPTAEQNPRDGLLSQWRAYGIDGGYAIVFGTSELDTLLKEEHDRFHYQHMFMGDVEYRGMDSRQLQTQPETLEQEKVVRDAIRDFLVNGGQDRLDPLLRAITMLSCSHKHRGFREESEVRIVAVPSNPTLLVEGQHHGDERPKKPVHFLVSAGVTKPYIKLFGTKSDGAVRKLPIRSIIVGPHPDQLRRRKAVKMLLSEHEVNAEIYESKIPYLGR